MFMQKSRAQRRHTRFDLLVVSCASLMLAGCSAEAEAPKAKNLPAAGSGALETAAGRYEFTPSTCAFYEQDGIYDIEIRGPGTAPDGEKFFFELSSTANALTIGLGVDRPYASPERKIEAGRVVSQEFTIVTSGRQLSVTNLMLVDENGASIDDHATLNIDCGVH